MSLRKNGFTMIEIMIVIAIIGLLATIAIPNFLIMQARAKQAEAKMNLAAAWTAQKAYFGEYTTYAGGDHAFELIGWQPMTSDVTRYAYIMDTQVNLPRHLPPLTYPAGIPPTNTGFTIIAAGNVDRDPFIDVWAINTDKRILNRVPTATEWTDDGNDLSN